MQNYNAFRKAKKQGMRFSKDRKTLLNCWNFKLKDVVIPDGVSVIGEKAFYYAGLRYFEPAFARIDIPESVRKIGEMAFSSSLLLSQVSIPNGVTEIGEDAFFCCNDLKCIIIPESVTFIGSGAFSGVHKVLSNNPNFQVDSSGVLIDLKKGILLYAPPTLSGNYTIPDNIAEIGKHAFWHCNDLTGITIPGHVEKIGISAFGFCHHLNRIDIHKGVSRIDSLAFVHCGNLTNLVLPDSVIEIGKGAFMYCDNLSSIDIPATCVKIHEKAFWACFNLNVIFFSKNKFEKRVFIGTDCERQLHHAYPNLFK